MAAPNQLRDESLRPFSLAASPDDVEELTVNDRLVRLFDAWRLRAYNYAVAIGAVPESAEEFVQEAFLRLFGQLSGGRRIGNVGGWLFRVVRNLVIDSARSRAREAPMDDFDFGRLCDRIVDPHPSAEQTILDGERMQRLHDDLKALTSQQREALFLRAEGFRHHEIATIMGLAPSSVSDLLRRAIRRLTRTSQ